MERKKRKQLEKEYKMKKVSICGYNINTMKIGNNFTAHLPMGKNQKDKAMFDSLVYYNQSVYHAKTRNLLIKKIRNWCKEFKERS